MAYTLENGSRGLDAETIDAMVKQIAAQTYKFKQAVSIIPTSSLDNTFFREDPTVLTGQPNAPIKGVPFGATFPSMSPNWEKKTVRVVKFAAENNIFWESIKGSAIDQSARIIIKLTQGVTKAVDDYIWDQLTESRNFAASFAIQTYSITLGRYWDVASAAIINDLMQASRLIAEANYDTSNLMAFVSPKDKQYIMKFLSDKGAQFPSLAQDVTVNGSIGKLAGIQLIESNSVTASFALVVVPKTCATYKEFESLKSTTITDPYKSLTIRVVEEGTIELTDPNAIVLIRGTQSGTN